MRRLRTRIARLVRTLFGSPPGSWNDELEGGIGVREPRRPLAPTLRGGAALELPDDDEPI